ncbi:substrate-binding domain-containing protein [Paenibacillus sp. D51F]
MFQFLCMLFYRDGRHLIEQGHRHIAMINGHNDAAVSLERLSGYRKTLEKHGIAYRPELVFNGSFSEEGGCEAMFEILLHHPEVTAVFSASDLMVLGALRAVERSRGKVPERISIVGCNDIAIAPYSSHKLTTIRQNKYEMGYQAAQLLVDLIEGRPVNHKIMLHNELMIIRAGVAGKSGGGCPPARLDGDVQRLWRPHDGGRRESLQPDELP